MENFKEFKDRIIDSLKEKISAALAARRQEIAATMFEKGEKLEEETYLKTLDSIKKYVNDLEGVKSSDKKKIISAVADIKGIKSSNMDVEIMKIMDKLGIE